MQAKNAQHQPDVAALGALVELRNALAHDDQEKTLLLSQAGVRSTLGYVRASQAMLNRHARALDKVVWDHLATLFPGADPWSP